MTATNRLKSRGISCGYYLYLYIYIFFYFYDAMEVLKSEHNQITTSLTYGLGSVTS